jgi:ribosome-binding factor A
MAQDRLTRVNELLRREIGTQLPRILQHAACDVATITITHVAASPNLRAARVLVSVRGDEAAQRQALRALRRHRVQFQDAVSRDVTLKYTPKLQFELDTSLRSGDHVLDVLAELREREAEETPEEDRDDARES